MNKNKVEVTADNIITIDLLGDQDPASIEAIGKDVISLINERKKTGDKILIFLNISGLGKISAETNVVAAQVLELLNYDRLAVFSDNHDMKNVSLLVISATGKINDTEVFTDKDKAISWLKGE